MSFLECFATNDLMLMANDILSDYNKLREETKNVVDHWFKQASSSQYYKEQDIIVKLERCGNLKKQYSEICDILCTRGYHYDFGQWHNSNNELFTPRDILHSA